MDKLNTPFGDIIVKINNEEIEYNYKKCDNDLRCPNLLGRYLLEVEFNPKGEEHFISCEVTDNYLLKSEIESGEMLECQSFYRQDRVKLSIGAYGECWGYIDGKLMAPITDYDIEYLPSGISYVVLENTKTNKFYFAVSWIDNVGYDDPINNDEHDRDVETWYGSDPIYLI